MDAKLKKEQVYVGPQSCYLAHRTTFGCKPWQYRAVVLGDAFGPSLLCAGATLEDALDEWDERDTARHVDFDDPDLLDYPGETAQDRVWAAVDAGDIRFNSGGTLAWVDHYEWCRTFATVREAGRFFRGIA